MLSFFLLLGIESSIAMKRRHKQCFAPFCIAAILPIASSYTHHMPTHTWCTIVWWERLDVDYIPDVVLKNEGSIVQTCRKTNVHVVNTDICWEFETHINVYGLHKKAVPSMYTAWAKFSFKNDSKNWNTHVSMYVLQNIIVLGFYAVVLVHEDLSIHVPITTVVLILAKLGWFQNFITSVIISQIEFWPCLKGNSNFWVPKL